MTARKVLHSVTLASVGLLSACAGIPNNADRTPSWLKHHVVGTRIPRVPDANGDASSANYVLTTTEAQLEDLPGVYIEKCMGSFGCR